MVIFKKEMIGKASVFILYAFIISLMAAILHFFFAEDSKDKNLQNWFYAIIPFIIGSTTIISWQWVKLDFRIINKEDMDTNFFNLNIASMLLFTGLISCLGIYQFLDCLIFLGIVFQATNKLVYIQTSSFAVSRLPQSVRDGISKSHYFFWNIYGNYQERDFIVTPQECAELKIFTNVLEDRLILESKNITHRYLKEFEKEFKKSIFDFNQSEIKIVEMAEI